MDQNHIQQLLTEEKLAELLPPGRADEFFEALLGDAAEGSYDIKLSFQHFNPEEQTLQLTLELHERPGKCLACNLTYGLPEVFSRHPIININGLVEKIDQMLGEGMSCREWRLGATRQASKSLHMIPLIIKLAPA
ncbi:hypothetical protein [Desulfurivibrio alkaliphilus]|uniref:Pancreas/duodenum homeobox protein 1 n=1 Tax=Desulfurivibrio alkaliphilus (strain DSM 19089 / UNIQEM U267 / AHT2) TaxID=589865 RepID=D6Z341_DESAT|nr:hypothetical protein [Desulfurivibrio alkaliphilus]ADH85966.1 conserved hypothetical protein [Desulfurivibrio alkaliphilus AHT 2]